MGYRKLWDFEHLSGLYNFVMADVQIEQIDALSSRRRKMSDFVMWNIET